MKKISRRQFIGRTAAGMGAAIAFSQLPAQILMQEAASFNDIPIGFQTWSVKEMLAKDFSGTLKMMAGMGYKIMEMCSPAGYATNGFGPLVDIKPADMKKMIEDAGLKCPSCHFGFGELTDHLDERIEWSKQMGLTQMVCSSFWLPDAKALKEYLDDADKLNKAAEKINKAGMATGFHNHEMEFKMLDGQLIYDALLKQLDPKLVKMQFQTEVINLGYKASTYFKQYPGRFISSHLSDWTADKKEVPIGQGVIDWKEFFAAAKTGGVKNFFVEMSLDKFKDSAAYIKSI
ncbi:MAG: xylose isomerase [Bacteroidetes bacterium]|nr:MAG: xylose isomerase [Bacteroidota bacterium]